MGIFKRTVQVLKICVILHNVIQDVHFCILRCCFALPIIDEIIANFSRGSIAGKQNEKCLGRFGKKRSNQKKRRAFVSSIRQQNKNQQQTRTAAVVLSSKQVVVQFEFYNDLKEPRMKNANVLLKQIELPN